MANHGAFAGHTGIRGESYAAGSPPINEEDGAAGKPVGPSFIGFLSVLRFHRRAPRDTVHRGPNEDGPRWNWSHQREEKNSGPDRRGTACADRRSVVTRGATQTRKGPGAVTQEIPQERVAVPVNRRPTARPHSSDVVHDTVGRRICTNIPRGISKIRRWWGFGCLGLLPVVD